MNTITYKLTRSVVKAMYYSSLIVHLIMLQSSFRIQNSIISIQFTGLVERGKDKLEQRRSGTQIVNKNVYRKVAT